MDNQSWTFEVKRSKTTITIPKKSDAKTTKQSLGKITKKDIQQICKDCKVQFKSRDTKPILIGKAMSALYPDTNTKYNPLHFREKNYLIELYLLLISHNSSLKYSTHETSKSLILSACNTLLILRTIFLI